MLRLHLTEIARPHVPHWYGSCGRLRRADEKAGTAHSAVEHVRLHACMCFDKAMTPRCVAHCISCLHNLQRRTLAQHMQLEVCATNIKRSCVRARSTYGMPKNTDDLNVQAGGSMFSSSSQVQATRSIPQRCNSHR